MNLVCISCILLSKQIVFLHLYCHNKRYKKIFPNIYQNVKYFKDGGAVFKPYLMNSADKHTLWSCGTGGRMMAETMNFAFTALLDLL